VQPGAVAQRDLRPAGDERPHPCEHRVTPVAGQVRDPARGGHEGDEVVGGDPVDVVGVRSRHRREQAARVERRAPPRALGRVRVRRALQRLDEGAEGRQPGQLRLAPPSPVPQQRRSASGGEHAGDLAARRGRPEPVEGLADEHRLDRPVGHGDRLGRARPRVHRGDALAQDGEQPATGRRRSPGRPAARAARDSLPVPAARSRTVAAGVTPSSRASHPTAAAGYGGRPRS
jgi:hypothetical protein